MPEKLPQVDAERQRKRAEFAAQHRTPTPETRIPSPVLEPVKGREASAGTSAKASPAGGESAGPEAKDTAGMASATSAAGKSAAPATGGAGLQAGVPEKAPAKTPVKAPAGTAGPAKEAKNRNKIIIPLPGGLKIEIEAPDNRPTWKTTLAFGKKFGSEVKGGKKTGFKRNIPTPFFGLALQLGIDVGVTAKMDAALLKTVTVEYNTSTGMAKVTGAASASMGLEAFIGLRAGVAADAWIAELGVGLKAKLIASLKKEAGFNLAFGYNVKSGGMPYFGFDTDLTALELALKGAVALFAYYDAVFVDTYEKEWTLFERSLGKLTVAGIRMGYNTKDGGQIAPKAMDLQNLDGNVRSLFPSHS